MNRSRIRRQRRRCAEKMLELIARGGAVCRQVEPMDRTIRVCVDLPRPGGGGWFMQVAYPIERLRGEVQP
jgi:hypothetical protein